MFHLLLSCQISPLNPVPSVTSVRTLSSATQTSIEIDSLYEGVDFYTSITRVCFEELHQDLFHSTLKPIEKVLCDSKIDKSNLHKIIISGSTCMPCITKLVQLPQWQGAQQEYQLR